MVVKVHCGTVLGYDFAAMLKMRPQNSPTMYFDNYLDTGLPRNIKVATQTLTKRTQEARVRNDENEGREQTGRNEKENYTQRDPASLNCYII